MIRDSDQPLITPEQLRASRAWLGWSQAELARRANVSERTVQTFERGQRLPHANSVAGLRHAVELAGIRFLFDQQGTAAGIALSDTEGEVIKFTCEGR